APALVRHFLVEAFPHLPRSLTRVMKLLDEGLGVAGSEHGVEDSRHQRQPLDPLRRPIRADLATGDSPYLFRVRLEKRAVQTLAEAVDDPLFEGLLRG